MDKVLSSRQTTSIPTYIIHYLSNLPDYDDRYPQPVSPWLNLVKLMTPTSWAWTLASLATVALCFNVASLVVRRWMGMRLENIEVDLWPFR